MAGFLPEGGWQGVRPCLFPCRIIIEWLSKSGHKGKPLDRSLWTAAFMLEKYISVRYNRKYEINKKGSAERVAALSAPMQEMMAPNTA